MHDALITQRAMSIMRCLNVLRYAGSGIKNGGATVLAYGLEWMTTLTKLTLDLTGTWVACRGCGSVVGRRESRSKVLCSALTEPTLEASWHVLCMARRTAVSRSSHRQDVHHSWYYLDYQHRPKGKWATGSGRTAWARPLYKRVICPPSAFSV